MNGTWQIFNLKQRKNSKENISHEHALFVRATGDITSVREFLHKLEIVKHLNRLTSR